jgi:hypothetical protein
MTLPERLYACPAAIHPSPLRAKARYAEVCFNSDVAPHNAHSTLRDQPGFPARDRSCCTQAHRSLSSRIPAGHLALIEIP